MWVVGISVECWWDYGGWAIVWWVGVVFRFSEKYLVEMLVRDMENVSVILLLFLNRKMYSPLSKCIIIT